MAGERLDIAPRARWEKIAAMSSGWLIFVPLFTSNLFGARSAVQVPSPARSGTVVCPGLPR